MTKYEKAKAAVDELFGDTSVPAEKTLEDIKLLWEEMGVMIESLETQIEVDHG